MAEFKPLAPETVETERDTYITISATGLEIYQEEDYDRKQQRIELTPRAAWDLLEMLYKYRSVLYHSTHIALPGMTPDWIGDPAEAKIVDSKGEE